MAFFIVMSVSTKKTSGFIDFFKGFDDEGRQEGQNEKHVAYHLVRMISTTKTSSSITFLRGLRVVEGVIRRLNEKTCDIPHSDESTQATKTSGYKYM